MVLNRHKILHCLIFSLRYIWGIVFLLQSLSAKSEAQGTVALSGERGRINDAGIQVIELEPEYRYNIHDSTFDHKSIPQGHFSVSKEIDQGNGLLFHFNETDLKQWHDPLRRILLLSLFFRFGYLAPDIVDHCKRRILVDSTQQNLNERIEPGYSQIIRLSQEILNSSAECIPSSIRSSGQPKYQFDHILTLPNFDLLYTSGSAISLQNSQSPSLPSVPDLAPTAVTLARIPFVSQPSAASGPKQLEPDNQTVRIFDKSDVLLARKGIAESRNQQNVVMYRPWEILKHLPDNTNRKKNLWWNLVNRSDVASLRKAIEDRRLTIDEMLKSYQKEVRKVKQKIGKLPKATAKKPLSEADNAKLAQLQKSLSDLEKAQTVRQSEIKEEVSQISIEKKSTEQIHYTHKIDGYTCHTKNAINSPYTVFYEGLDNSRNPASISVKSVLNETAFSQSVKNILLSVSSNEGKFWTINTYDRMLLTWGMFQWAGGDTQSSLFKALQGIKQLIPAEYNFRFQRFGIDIDEKKHVLKVMSSDGNWLLGRKAAEYIKDSPELTAVFCVAGQVKSLQKAQITVAISNQIVRAQSITLQETPLLTSSQVFTSEFGLGLIVDSIIHEGAGSHGGRRGAIPRMDRAFRLLVSKKPYIEGAIDTLKDCSAIMASVVPKQRTTTIQAIFDYVSQSDYHEKFPLSWNACADKYISIGFILKWPNRAQSFHENCSKQPESFKK